MIQHLELELFSEDTIAAIATAPGVGAVGMVRLSGPQSLQITQSCFVPHHEASIALPDHRMVYGQWVDPSSRELLDEVMVVAMREPRSYTRENMVEIFGHGGPLILKRILGATLKAGARLARPGEFTLRAFCRGRIDLIQAEAVADLISAETDAARRLALRSLRGGLSETVITLKEQVVDILSNLETHLEFPMEDVDPMPVDEMIQRLNAIKEPIAQLLEMANRSEIYRRGIFTVLTGRPNVGKSLLFNRILGRGRALVTPHPGTTRDTIEETVSLEGMELLLVDTAGVRQTGEEVEKLGIARTVEAAGQADMVWFLTDSQEEIGQEDEYWLARVIEIVGGTSIPLFLLQNKIDCTDNPAPIQSKLFLDTFPSERRFAISAQTGQGLEAFMNKIRQLFLEEGKIRTESDLMVNPRQRRNLYEIKEALDRIESAIESQLSLDCVAIDLWAIKEGLDRLDGTKSSDDLLGEIFSRFCIGK